MDSANTKVVTFDLQSVLQLPAAEVSQLYYKRKICVYNLTIYECSSSSKEAHCYVWSEIDGKRGSSEIGTCLIEYIKQLPEAVKHLILFSDSCGGQNRNQFVAAAMVWAVNETALETVELCFLESGHTQMECDSMHAAIEHEKRNKTVFTVSEWMNVMKASRRKNPYKVHQLHFNNFFDLKQLCEDLISNRNIDTDGNKVNWLHIKVLKFEKGEVNRMKFKLDHDAEEFGTIEIKRTERGRPASKNLKQAYRCQQAISLAKKKDLLDLCSSKIIPIEYHGWYKGLSCSKVVRDVAEIQEEEDSSH